MENAAVPRRASIVARWKGLSPVNRRRIVLGSLFAMALAARDLMLLAAASGALALSEMGTATRPAPSPA